MNNTHMHKSRFAILLIYYIFYCANSFSQEDFEEVKPELEMLSSKIDKPEYVSMKNITEENYVNPHTGSCNYGISLFEINYAKMNLPINLSYISNGFKVGQISSDVGLGWELYYGGTITRNVHGLPDDYKTSLIKGFLYNENFKKQNNTNWSSFKDEEIEDLGYKKYDTQPDLFHYSINGKQGSFFFDNEKNIHQIPKTNYSIMAEFSQEGSISTFTILSDIGIKYNFIKGNEYVDNVFPKYRKKGIKYTSSWVLSEISSQFGRIKIEYSSLNEEYSETLNHSYTYYFNRKEKDFDKTPAITLSKRTIKKIVWDQGFIDFKYEKDRDDLNSTKPSKCKALTKVEIYNCNKKLIKWWDLEQDYFAAYKTIGSGYLNKYLKLNKVVESSIKSHSFYYSLQKCPSRLSYEQDYWGYFNKNGANTLKGIVYAYPEDGDHSTYNSYLSIFRRQNFKGPEIILDDNAFNRNSTDACGWGMLEEIQVPTGGRIVFNYGLHDFLVENKKYSGAGLRVNSFQLKDEKGEVRVSKEIKYKQNGITTGKLCFLPKIAKVNFEIKRGISKSSLSRKITRYSMLNNYEASDLKHYVRYESVDVGEENNGYIRNRYTVFGYVGEESRNFDGQTVSAKVLAQNNISRVLPVNYPTCNDCSSYHNYEDSEQKLLDKTVGSYNYYSTWVNGLLLSSVNYNKNSDPIHQKIFNYQLEDFEEFNYFVVNSYSSYTGSLDCTMCYDEKGNASDDIQNEVSFLRYNLFRNKFLSAYINIDDVKVIDKRENKEIIKLIDYQHENGLLISTQKEDSDGSQIKNTYRYPHNFAISSKSGHYDPLSGTIHWTTINNVYQDMVKANIVAYPIELVIEKNDKTIDAEIHNYSKFSGLIRKSSVEKLSITKPINDYVGYTVNDFLNSPRETKDSRFEESISYDLYDYRGNILQYHDNEEVAICFVWGYNHQYPIAKIENATYPTDPATIAIIRALEKIKKVDNIDLTALKNIHNAVRSCFPTEANITLYTYDPLIGMTSQTNPNGLTEYYEYDSFGKLQFIRDHEGNILKKYSYNYAKQTSN